ncbi:MAG: cold-shock protein [Gammaproteobacteria bacterium]|nr:cold-shock protein [Gammaproteobacteria bacterium]
MNIGTVKWFNRTKGYGLISPRDGGKDVFVFYPTIETDGHQTLEFGQTVRYESVDCLHGERTVRVVPVN